MPTITLNDGRTLHVTYAKAAEAKAYLDDNVSGHRVSDIEDDEQRRKVVEFISTIKGIDFTDVNMASPTGRVNNEEVRKVLADDTLKGYAKFAAMRRAMGR